MVTPALPRSIAGRYEVKQVLGQGDLSIVYRAIDVLSGADLALKILHFVPDAITLELLRRDCTVVSQMKDSRLIEVLDIGGIEEEATKNLYLVMPLVMGATLRSLIKSASHRLTVQRTVQIVSEVCLALQNAHQCGLVHGDLKPSNIFLLDDDAVRITDFGFRWVRGRLSNDQNHSFYMSPEQIQNHTAEPASDVFSL